jgi:predicted CXXCH cytochrome family protein
MQSSLTKSSSRRRVLGVLALAGLVVAIVAISGTAFALDRENHDAFCASCHTYYGGHYHHPAITTSKLGDGSCLKCHSDVTANRSFNNHFHLFLARWQSVDPNAANCVDCHTSHPTGNPAQAYLAQATIVPVCQDCHQAVGEGR